MVQADTTSNSDQPTSRQKLRSPTSVRNHVTRDFHRQQVREKTSTDSLAHSKNELMQWRGVRRLSVRL